LPSGWALPCAVISAPVHVQDFPARYSPQMGFEGANVIFDTWVHPLMMGLEEHLLTMFMRISNSTTAPGRSRMGRRTRCGASRRALPMAETVAASAPAAMAPAAAAPPASAVTATATVTLAWAREAEAELNNSFSLYAARRAAIRNVLPRSGGQPHHRRNPL
jgi:light-independent protochlorophyllide reductase subunit B